MKISIQEIIDFLGDNILNLYGNTQDVFIDNIADAERVNETTLDWINPSKTNKQEIAEKSKAKEYCRYLLIILQNYRRKRKFY